MGDKDTDVDEGAVVVRTDAGDGEVVEVQRENQDVQQEKDEKEVKKRKAMAPRSDVWDDFTEIFVGGLPKKAKCKYCGRICKKNPNKNQGTIQLQLSPDSSVGIVGTWRFDLEELRNSFVEMMIEDELPFVFAERLGFKRFMAKSCPRFTMPSRRTAIRACVSVHDTEKKKLKDLKAIEGKTLENP
ncbi:hypothetical protein U9M48_000684 [Paspalum notatum var. saurae]|uniref:BED-type domain-containing protein n=1 Tax=Paspalum notatum var. saurae TaxID=547442 RepID=A0AAQ3PE68_PASNO